MCIPIIYTYQICAYDHMSTLPAARSHDKSMLLGKKWFLDKDAPTQEPVCLTVFLVVIQPQTAHSAPAPTHPFPAVAVLFSSEESRSLRDQNSCEGLAQRSAGMWLLRPCPRILRGNVDFRKGTCLETGNQVVGLLPLS